MDVTGGLQALASRVRRVLGSATLSARGGGYQLDGVDCDAGEFDGRTIRGAAFAAAGDPHGAAREYRAALALWRGRVLDGFSDREFARIEAARLDEARCAAIEGLADSLLAAGMPGEAVAVLEAHVAEQPFREEAVATLLLALHRVGRRADALGVYRTVRARIAVELGLEPGPALRRRHEEVLADSADLAERSPPGVRRPVVPSHGLPRALGAFVGREQELAELAVLLAKRSLLTLWGSGGAGKTRLSIELARRAAGDFRDGVWFVDLAAVTEPEQVAPAAMAAVGMLGAAEDPVLALIRYLTDRQSLLVLDNCEHIVDAAAHLADQVLAGCPEIRLLATSREPPAIAEECLWPAPALTLPADDADPIDSDAVAFFVHRVELTHPGFALDADNTVAVIEICRRLDGMPLALELAASRVRTLGVHGVAAGLDDRFALLVSGHRTADPRQRTLRATVDWSWDLLDLDEQDLLARLSVFPGTFDAAAVATVGGQAVELLTRLVDRSLVRVESHGSAGARYRLLETIRQYGADELDTAGRTTETRDRHLRHFLVERPPFSSTLGGEVECDGIWADRDNYRAALAWSLESHNGAAAVELGARMFEYWVWSADPADRPGEWMRRALWQPDYPRDRFAAMAMVQMAWWTSDPGPLVAAGNLAASLGDRKIVGGVHWVQAVLAGPADLTAAEEHLDAGLRASRTDRFAVGMSVAHHGLAWLAIARGDYATAHTHVRQALALVSRHGPGRYYQHDQYRSTLVVTLALRGEAREAMELGAACVEASRRTDLRGVHAMTLLRAATAAVLTESDATAADYLRDLLVPLRRLGTSRWVGDALELTAILFVRTRRAAAAAAVIAALDRHAREVDETPAGGIPALAEAFAAARGHSAADRPIPGAGPAPSLDDALRTALAALDGPQPSP